MRVKHLRPSLLFATFGVALTITGCGGSVPVAGDEAPRPVSHGELAGPPALRAKAKDLERTVVTAHLKEPIKAGRNVLWCNTFQLAWNELCEFFGEDVRLEDEPPMVPILNEKLSTKADVDAASYVALAEIVKDGIIGRIEKALEGKFKGLASPELVPDPTELDPTDIVAYAYLFKNLVFATPFESPHSIWFRGKRVEAFGIEKHGRKTARTGRQVLIHDYVSRDDFVIELDTKASGDRLILAKVEPAGTLLQTVRAVQGRLDRARPERMVRRDILKIPKLNFDITRRYGELIPKNLVNPKGEGYFIKKALQDIRFRLDEKGAFLKSEAMILVKALEHGPGPRHVMIFDEPFLILILRRGRDVPYFALWVDNPELLVAAKRAEGDRR